MLLKSFQIALIILCFQIQTIEATELPHLNQNAIKDQGIQKYKIDSSTYWIAIDTVRLSNPGYFRPIRSHFKDEINNTLQIKRLSQTDLVSSYTIWIGFVLFLICAFLFGRLFPFQFRLQWDAFFSKNGMRRLLDTGSDWLEVEKIFPFFISVLYSATWISYFLTMYFDKNTGMELSILTIGIVFISAVFIVIRMIQHFYGFALNIESEMSDFIKSSLNTTYILSFIIFPFSVLLYLNQTDTSFILLYSLIVLYTLRTLKSIFLTFSKGLRPIFYLILYLCTFEIPMMLLGLKWIIKLGN
jgi:hypothetical protein